MKDRTEHEEGFLRRWSRLKTDPEPAKQAPVASTPASADATGEAPVLPPVEELTLDSDFRGFFHPKVDEKIRRAALRKLFSDPHFNVMDGLDTYIDDYSKSDPIPPEMLAEMKQARRILDWAQDKETEPEEIVEGSVQAPSESASDPPAETLAVAESQSPEVTADSMQARDPVPIRKE
jgi:hypothetical protein